VDYLRVIEFLAVSLMMMLAAMTEMASALADKHVPRLSLWFGVAMVSAYLPRLL
jgi:hypothetical protein